MDMSESNIQQPMLDFLSPSTTLSPILPSLSELLAQERIAGLLRPCLQQLLKILQKAYPFSRLFQSFYLYKDEVILIIESILQWFYLHSYSALLGEHFYGLKRTADHRLRSLIFSVFLPYVKLKVDSIRGQITANDADPHLKYYMILQMLPKIQTFIDCLNWLYHLSYAVGLTKYYSPSLQLANVKLTYARDPSPTIPSLSNTSRYLSIISQIISNGLLVIQLIDWWNKSYRPKKILSNNSVESSSSVTTRKRPIINGKRWCPLCQQPCSAPTLILGSSYVYCYACIKNYIQRFHRCPMSNQPVTIEDLIKIY